MSGRRKKGRDISGWVAFDKPVGITSTQAVARIKRLFNTAKAGHAGTLDPLASGCLPIALGEATKTVPFVVDGRKIYRFTVKWGEETTTDDTEGEVAERSAHRPAAADIEAALAAFTGEISQRPPSFSAIKVDGERAYNLAREGNAVELEPRIVTVHRLGLVEAGTDDAVLEAECGKGTYVRAIARDLGRALGTFGHVTALRRTRVGPFPESSLVTLAQLEECTGAYEVATACDAWLLPIQTALAGLTEIAVANPDAARIRRGQSVILRGRDAPIGGGFAYATQAGRLVAIGEVDRGSFLPNRVFHPAGG